MLEKALRIYENLAQGQSVVAAQVGNKLGFTYQSVNSNINLNFTEKILLYYIKVLQL